MPNRNRSWIHYISDWANLKYNTNMKKHLINSAIATVCLYVAFACANAEPNPIQWETSIKIIFLLCVGMCDVFVIRKAEKQKQNKNG